MTNTPSALGSPATAAVAPLLELIGDTFGLLEINEFRHGVLHALRRAVPADWIALNDIGPDPSTILAIIDPPASAAQFESFRRHAAENPLIQRHSETRDGRAVRFSDVISQRRLHSLTIYRELYRPMGIEFQIAFTLPTGPDRLLGIALSRGASDFTDGERDLLNAARPFLIQAYTNALRYSELLSGHDPARPGQRTPELERLVALGLTARQASILALVATGASDRGIASHLQISPRTVQKHLQRCYRTLAVSSRAQAIEVAWGTLASAATGATIHGPERDGAARSPR